MASAPSLERDLRRLSGRGRLLDAALVPVLAARHRLCDEEVIARAGGLQLGCDARSTLTRSDAEATVERALDRGSLADGLCGAACWAAIGGAVALLILAFCTIAYIAGSR